MKTSLDFVCCVCVICTICGSAFAGTRSSPNYSITTETIDAAGNKAQSANYSLHDSEVGEFGAGSSEIVTSASYTDKIAYAGQLSDMLDPITAVSRKIHGGAGTFDINLPLVGTTGVECRTALSGNSYTIVFTFANPLASVANVTASSTGGGQPGATGNIDNTDAHNYIVTLSQIANAQYTTIALSNVQDSDINSGSIVQTTMAVLLGDVNGDGFVLSGDYTAVRQKSGAQVNGNTFKFDINADGFILSGDYTTVRQLSGAHLP
jgi:hypothetical protein